MKVIKNATHNSIELDFEGVKPNEEIRNLIKAYGFWWFQKGKVWCHSLDVDGDFFEEFVEKRVKPLLASKVDVNAAIDAMGQEERQALLNRLLGKES